MQAGAQCACAASQRVKQLEDEARELRKRAADAENILDSYDMVKKLRKMMRKMEKKPSAAVEADKVNIGGGVLVETTLLERLHSHCQGPTKFARHLLRSIFTVEEMRGKSLFGKGSNANKNAIVKEALDPVRVNAVIGYTCSKFATTTLHLKNSLSSMLARELNAYWVQLNGRRFGCLFNSTSISNLLGLILVHVVLRKVLDPHGSCDAYIQSRASTLVVSKEPTRCATRDTAFSPDVTLTLAA
ncbi:uncharacterized protein LOC125943141 [Dermacentor silvarum]|uniref:uncharacterized protein LOC125943141 n=1 Tax=Dermacentor silvarum TaxID=543639 RepID=UPI002101BFA0|nr:uncharacterized protein LOC125943141 [Dermacentor silvarum]